MNVSSRRWFGILALSLTIGWLTGGVRAEDKKSPNNATGTWKSTFSNAQGQSIETVYKLVQDGEKLTGTATGGRGKQVSIEDGTVKDGVVTFHVNRGMGNRKFMAKYQGKLSGDTIKGKVEVSFGGQSRSANWVAKREKQKLEKKSG